MNNSPPVNSELASVNERLRSMMQPCAYCGAEFLSAPRKGRLGGRSRFCSAKCANESRTAAAAALRLVSKTCNVCQKEKPPSEYPPDGRLTCKKCLSAAAYARRLASGEPRPCDQCGAIFQSAKSHAGISRFCSKLCASAALIRKTERPCMHCGKPVLRAADADRVYCDLACRDAHSIGPNNPTWRGGVLRDGSISVYVGKRKGFKSKSSTMHRVVASKIIGRQLTRQENIIHIDGNNGNNQPSNIFLCESKSECMRRIRGITLPFPTSSNLEQVRAAEVLANHIYINSDESKR